MREHVTAKLAEALDEQLTVIDVGARWGAGDRWSAFGTKLRVFGFDPDKEECERLNARGETSVRYVPVALGAKRGRAPLYLTTEPACASLYPPVETLPETFPGLALMAPAGRDEIDIETLDEWCAANDVDRVDAVKLDAQGAELEVFEGGTGTLASVQLLEVEVEFNPLYVGQPLFGDVDRFLRSNGFVLWRLANLVHYSTAELPGMSVPFDDVAYFDGYPVEPRFGGGQLYWGHAYFVREELTASSRTRIPWRQALRAASVAAAYGLVDLSVLVLRRAANAGPQAALVDVITNLARRSSE